MPRYLVHIGLHKTASTYLQQSYLKNIENATVFSYHLRYELLGRMEVMDNVIISNEGLSGSPWNMSWIRGVSNNHDWMLSFKTSVLNIKKLYPEGEILIVLRKHGDFLISLYKQYLHEGGVLKFKDFFSSEGVIKPEHLIYEKRLQFLSEHFKKVHVMNFEEFKISGDSYFNMFFNSLNLSVVKNEQYIDLKTNKSVSGKKINLLRIANILYAKSPRYVKNICAKNKLTPREIFQNKLSKLNSKDSKDLEEIRNKINSDFNQDWAKILENSFKI